MRTTACHADCGPAAWQAACCEDDGLSRRHFMVLREGADYLIKDLSSRNGTWVHGHRAVTARLSHNDCILAGHTLFRFCEERAAVSPALQAGAAAR